MAGEASAVRPSTKALAWPLFDRIVSDARDGSQELPGPWIRGSDGVVRYAADYATLERLLGVPLHLHAATTTGVPALALDVWFAYELRRSGFAPDAVWPRATHPRILPGPVAALLDALPRPQAQQLRERLTRAGNVRGVTASTASILGKNYAKQVDVIMADWATGPELLISTKRMDSSYGKNAPNRVEESYGDAKNLRLRHPLAALGFALGLRTDVFDKEPETAEWLLDLLAKLGQEDDAYHATCVVLMQYQAAALAPGYGRSEQDPLAPAGPDERPDEDAPVDVPGLEVAASLAVLPEVHIDQARTPANLSPARFLATMVEHVLDTTPVNLHVEARRLRRRA